MRMLSSRPDASVASVGGYTVTAAARDWLPGRYTIGQAGRAGSGGGCTDSGAART